MEKDNEKPDQCFFCQTEKKLWFTPIIFEDCEVHEINIIRPVCRKCELIDRNLIRSAGNLTDCIRSAIFSRRATEAFVGIAYTYALKLFIGKYKSIRTG